MTQTGSSPIQSESQQQRWFKYGANVVLASVLVIALAVLAIYISERKSHRFDTTASGLYSLKPQTLNLIKDNKQPITIISLYTKAKPGQPDVDSTGDDTAAPAVDQPGVVSDLLEEYRTRGSNISAEVIDPVQNPSKVDDLINQVQEQYGGEIKKYKTFTSTVPDKYESISKLANTELDNIKKLPLNQIQSDDVAQSVELALFSVQEIPKIMKTGQEEYARFLKKKPPDYKGITDNVAQTMQGLSEIVAKVIDGFNKSKIDNAVPAAIRQYMADSQPKYIEIKKQADDLIAQQKLLGELKLDTLREALRQKNPILVRGTTEWRVIPYDKVWKTDARDARSAAGPVRPRFAGEQQITTAILSLNQPAKPKVCFVRNGGPPITDFGGRLNSFADKLRDYNFDVTEKDLSGMWAMQAMQQQQQAPTEPSDADIADAVWVLDGAPAQQNPMMGGPPPSNAQKITEHLEKGFHYVDGKKTPGGSALLFFVPKGDDLSATLQPWGISARTDAVAVHQLIASEGETSSDVVNAALHTPYIFTFNHWGDNEICRPISSLLGLLLAVSPIEVKHMDGVTNSPIMPVPGAPDSPACWGETDLTSIEAGPKFDKESDIAAPLFAGAVAEKSGKRIVCCGSENSFSGSSGSNNNLLDLLDPELEKRNIAALEFPGDAEFIMNSIFWLSHQEAMISISPAAMTVSRISDMSKGVQRFWDVGILLIGLPSLVLVIGLGAYLSRRD